MARSPKRILFATSNGTGLGHLNRAMAIARRLPEGHESSFFTLSQAAPVVDGVGYPVDYLASYRRPASGTDFAWNMRLRALLEDLIEQRRPDLVVFDGVHPYRALTHVLSAKGAPASLWCRRAMWRAGSSEAPLKRAGAFDAVLEPGDLAASEDRGPTVAQRRLATHVDPIVFLDRAELLDRERAAAALGLDPGRRTVLVNLGQGGEVDRAVERTLAMLAAHPEIQVAALQSSIGSELRVPGGVVRLRATFPMSRYFAAFDMAVAAAGYNAFHELMAFSVPALLVPMSRNTDDQSARARWAASSGAGLAVEGPGDPALEARLTELLDPAVGSRLATRSRDAFGSGTGAERAADLVAAMAAGRTRAPAVRNRGRFNRWLRLSSHPVGPSLPLSQALGARDLLRHPERRRPLLVVLALGVPSGEIGDRVAASLAEAAVPASRALVLTDGFEFAPLRSLGVGFERVPGRTFPDGHVERERARGQALHRAQVLLAGRRPLRAVSIGEWGADLLGAAATDEREDGGR